MAAAAPATALVLGGTGRTGGRVVSQLLDRGVGVRAIVRSADRLPEGVRGDARLEVLEADVLALSDEELWRQVAGCDAVVSCLGHSTTPAGIYAAPRDLVEEAVRRVCAAVQAIGPDGPVKVILMSSVSVNDPRGADTRRGAFEKTVLALLRGVLPPARDNQRAADALREDVGIDDPRVRWVVVRPDTLLDGGVTPYSLSPGLVNGLFSPGETNMANVAHFMCDLVTRPEVWSAWEGAMPTIVNES